jgi:regulator of protease activity HflC (stomatin/prohibitin superfamily)
MRNLIISGVLILVGIVVLSQTCYVVDETEQVIVTRFGDVRTVERNPGLRVKVPFVDSAVRFDRRLLRIDADAEAMRDIEKQDLTIDSYARYRINDPVQFRKTLITPENAVSRLGDIVNSTLRERIALRTRPEIIGARPVLDQFGNQVEDEEGLPLFEGSESRTSLLSEVLEGVRLRVIAQEINREVLVPINLQGDATFDFQLDQVVLDADNIDRDSDLNTGVGSTDIRVEGGVDGGETEGPDLVTLRWSPAAGTVTFGVQQGETIAAESAFNLQYFVDRDEPLGIELVDVRIKRADFPDSVTPSIFTRMRAERNRIATRFRAEGEEEDLKIRAVANRNREVILAEADQESNEIRGEGEAKAISILAEALNQDPEFFAFRRSLQAYTAFLGSQDKIILSSEEDLFKYLSSYE